MKLGVVGLQPLTQHPHVLITRSPRTHIMFILIYITHLMCAVVFASSLEMTSAVKWIDVKW